jgi:AraC-like DNA-binding protein
VELAAIASALHVSPRSFQRKLQEQGQSFTQLVDGVRRELAERYLADAALDLTDIAFLLGFSEQSAFTRAYKRWSGRAPAAVRGR